MLKLHFTAGGLRLTPWLGQACGVLFPLYPRPCADLKCVDAASMCYLTRGRYGDGVIPVPGRTGRHPESAQTRRRTSQNRSFFFFETHCSLLYCFSGAGSKLWCVAHITLFIWYEKFRTCYITIRASETNIKAHSLGLSPNTRVILFLLPWCDAVLCRNLTCPLIINADQSAQIGPISQPSLL